MNFFIKKSNVFNSLSRKTGIAIANRNLNIHNMKLSNSISNVPNNLIKTTNKSINHNINNQQLFNKALMKHMVKDISVFNKKISSRNEELKLIDKMLDNKQLNKNQKNILQKDSVQFQPDINKNIIPKPEIPTNVSPNNTVNDKSKIENEHNILNLSPDKLQKLVDTANSGVGTEKENAVKTLKQIIQQNKNISPKFVAPASRISPNNPTINNNEKDIPPMDMNLCVQIIKELKTTVINDENLDYKKYIECIYNIAYVHKSSPVIFPILNKAIGNINRVSLYKLPGDLFSKFISTVLKIFWPDTFK